MKLLCLKRSLKGLIPFPYTSILSKFGLFGFLVFVLGGAASAIYFPPDTELESLQELCTFLNQVKSDLSTIMSDDSSLDALQSIESYQGQIGGDLDDIATDLNQLRILYGERSYSMLSEVSSIPTILERLEDVLRYDNSISANSELYTSTGNINGNLAALRKLLMYQSMMLTGQTMTRVPEFSQINKSTNVLERLSTIVTLLESNATNMPSVVVTNSITNAIAQELAGNPWWYTNSAFTLWGKNWTHIDPSNGDFRHKGPMTFPQVFSGLSMALFPYDKNGGLATALPSSWSDTLEMQFGVLSPSGRIPGRFMAGSGYSWFDWESDWQRWQWLTQSNATFRAVMSNELAQQQSSQSMDEYTQNEYGVSQEDSATNFVLDELDLNSPEVDTRPLSAPFLGAGSFSISFPQSTSGSEVTIVPQMEIGNLTIEQETFNLSDMRVKNAVHGICNALWVLVGVLLYWGLVKTEYGFWSTLGASGGDAA